MRNLDIAQALDKAAWGLLAADLDPDSTVYPVSGWVNDQNPTRRDSPPCLNPTPVGKDSRPATVRDLIDLGQTAEWSLMMPCEKLAEKTCQRHLIWLKTMMEKAGTRMAGTLADNLAIDEAITTVVLHDPTPMRQATVAFLNGDVPTAVHPRGLLSWAVAAPARTACRRLVGLNSTDELVWSQAAAAKTRDLTHVRHLLDQTPRGHGLSDRTVQNILRTAPTLAPIHLVSE